MEKYGRARQGTDDNIKRRMRFARWITKATDTHSEYVILYCFSTAKMLSEAPLNYIVYTLRLLLCYADKRQAFKPVKHVMFNDCSVFPLNFDNYSSNFSLVWDAKICV
jgi:hypothetical protein